MNISKCIEDLAPVTNGENQEVYIELLKDGINNKKIKNIALSGPYGSGKSSIIQKFLSTLPAKEKGKYIEISLPNFDNNVDPEEEEQYIEKSILQQIFYKVPKEDLPYSRLERTEEKSHSNIIGNTIVFFVWVLSFYVFTNEIKIKEILIDLFGFQELNIQTLIVLFGIIPLLFSSFYIIYLIVKGTGKIKLNKLSFQGVNLEVDNEKGSLINRYLDEILYFFEATDYEILIIEDLDRANGTKIFQKLREINILLNNYTKIQNKKRITFVYAVKDSIFTGEERTKFFDLIIPVVPIINANNAKDKLIQKFEKIGILDNLGKDFIRDISYYLENYRQLTNVVNEFCIYIKALDSNTDYQKLFALIIYKNLFPEDFSDLQIRQGMLFEILHNKKTEIRKKIISKLKRKLDEIDERLQNIKEEHLNNERELRLIFASRLFDEVGDLKLFDNNNSPTTITELVDNEELFNKYVVEGGQLTYYYNLNAYGYRKNYNFEGDSSGEYEKRLKILKDTVLEKNKKLSQEKANIEEEIIIIKNKKFFELIDDEDDKGFLDIQNIIDSNEKINQEEEKNWILVKKLITEGYIDEEYGRYISYFHEGELTRNDYEFINKIKNGETIDFEHQLDNVEVVINELSIYDIQRNIEHFAISEYFFENNINNDKKTYFIANFFNKSSEIFLREFIAKNIKNKIIVSNLLKEASRQNKIKKLLCSIKDESTIKEFLINIIDKFNNVEMSEDDKLQFDDLLVSFLFDIYNKLENKEIINKYLQEKRIIFEALTDSKYSQSKELFEFVYKHNLYELSYVNIHSILINLYGFKVSEEINLKTANLTTIREYNPEELLQIIDNRIVSYFENSWNVLEKNTKESVTTLLYLLNHSDLEEKQKKVIINKSENKLDNLKDIKDRYLWHVLLELNKIEVTWDNIFEYYVHKESLDEILFDFLNNNANSKKLSATRIDNKYFEKNQELKDKDAMGLLRDILENNNFENENYTNLIKSYGYWYSDLNIEELDNEKIKILINTGRLMPKTKVYDDLREQSPELAKMFILHYKKEYFSAELSITLDSDVLVCLLNSSLLTNEEKFQIIENLDVSIFKDDKLSKEVSMLYIKYHKAITDDHLYEALFYDNNNRPNEWALDLFVSQIDDWTCEECQRYIIEFGEPYNELLEKSASKLYMENTPLNRLLLEKLRNKNCISSYKHSRNNKLKIERKRV